MRVPLPIYIKKKTNIIKNNSLQSLQDILVILTLISYIRHKDFRLPDFGLRNACATPPGF